MGREPWRAISSVSEGSISTRAVGECPGDEGVRGDDFMDEGLRVGGGAM